MEASTPENEHDLTVDFYISIFGRDIEPERQESESCPIIEADIIATLVRIEDYAASHDTKAKILFAEVGERVAAPFLTACDPAGKVFMVIGPGFYDGSIATV